MIPFLDLQAQYREIEAEAAEAVLGVLRRAEYVLGPSVAAFESNFAAYCGAQEAIAVNSGTSALHLALLALDIGPGDEVITVPATFIATAAAIRYAGATPVFVDIDPETWTLDPKAIEPAITPRTKAVIPVHLHGRLADMEAILAVARRHGLAVIEDAAQSHGAKRRGTRAGTFGDIGCFSFYPGKNLGACGEGGGIVTNDPALAERMRKMRDWGQNGRYNHELPGFNYRMDGIQGAILDIKLRHLPRWTDLRRAVAAQYDEQLADVVISTPKKPAGYEHVYHVYAVRTPRRDALQTELKQRGIATNIHYPRPVHLQPSFADLGYRQGAFPQSEALAAETLSLPIYPELSSEAVAEVTGALRQLCGEKHADAAE
jgi:dTDP-4-amino-4,6-dideoxygalactose transaminase